MCVNGRKIAVGSFDFAKNVTQNESADDFFWRSCFDLPLFGQFKGKLDKNSAGSALI